MRFSRPGLIVATVIVVLVAGVGLSRGTGPCAPYVPVELTGTLVEVTRDGTPVPSDDPILSAVPRVVCVRPLNGIAAALDVSDCYDSRFDAVFRVETP
jgi:hypothetical protein